MSKLPLVMHYIGLAAGLALSAKCLRTAYDIWRGKR